MGMGAALGVAGALSNKAPVRFLKFARALSLDVTDESLGNGAAALLGAARGADRSGPGDAAWRSFGPGSPATVEEVERMAAALVQARGGLAAQEQSGMTAAAAPVRLNYNDYVLYTETHPEGAFELLDGVIFELAPEGDAHVRTRMAIELYLTQMLDLARYTPCTEVSFPAPDWFDGPRPDNLVARGPGLVDGRIRERPIAEEVALVIEVSSTSRRKDQQKAKAYARLAIPA